MSFDLQGKIRITDDGASRVLKNITKQTDDVRRATDNYRDSTSKMRTSQNRFIDNTEKMNRELKESHSLFGSLKGAFAGGIGFGLGNAVLNGIGNVASATAGFVGDSVKKAMDFEAQMLSIQALTGATSTEIKGMQNLALFEGARTKYNALEAGKAIEELLKAGLTPAKVEAGALGAALDLATAGGLGLEESAVVMSTALNAFKKDGMAASTAADILAGTANASATGVHELSESLAQVSAVAAGSGLSFKDANLALGVFANNGLKGSDAGTSLKQMLLTLQPITKNQIALFDGLGFTTNGINNQFYDSAGNLKSMADISGVLRAKLGKLNSAQRQLTLKLMFGTDAIRAANILYEEGADGIKKFNREMANTTALSVAKKKMEGAGGAVEQFKGALETLQISALLPTMPLITRFANSMSNVITKYSPQITASMEKMAAKASGFIDKYFTNNAEFKKLPDLEAKIKWAFDSVKVEFDKWWSGGGKAAFAKMTENVVGFMVNSLEASIPALTAMGVTLGAGIASGIVNGIADNFNILKVINPANAAKEEFDAQYTGAEELKKQAEKHVASGSKEPVYGRGGEIKAQEPKPWYKKALGFAGGLDNVPYNNYPARLHAGEAVLTREENKDYRENGGSGGGGQVVITGNTFHVREEADIQKIAGQLARLMAT